MSNLGASHSNGVLRKIAAFFREVWETSVSFYKGLTVTIVNMGRTIFNHEAQTVMWNPHWHESESEAPPWEIEVPPPLAQRYRGVMGLTSDLRVGVEYDDGGHKENCVGCLACERVCPDRCILIDTESRDGHKGKFVTNFIIDFNVCSFCGLCVEVCPVPALVFTSDITVGGYTHGDLILNKDALMRIGDREQNQWMESGMGDAAVVMEKKSQQLTKEEESEQAAKRAARGQRSGRERPARPEGDDTKPTPTASRSDGGSPGSDINGEGESHDSN